MANDVIFEPHWQPQAALIRFNRPEKSNAVTAESARFLLNCLQDAEDNPDTRCIVIRGSRKLFSAGADLGEMSSADPAVVLRIINQFTKIFLAIRTSMLPVITVVEGACVGGGYHINMASDYTIATENAWFRHTGVDVGIAPMMPGTVMLPGVVGLKRASSMVLNPRRINATEALQIGLCSELVSSENLEQVLHERIREFAGRDAMTVALGKAEINVGLGPTLSGSMLAQLAGFMHSIQPSVHAKMRSYHEALGS